MLRYGSALFIVWWFAANLVCGQVSPPTAKPPFTPPPPRVLPRIQSQPMPASVSLPPAEAFQSVDWRSVEVRLVHGNWQLLTNGQVIRDFARDSQGAIDLARIIREQRLDRFRQIGETEPALEYWLRGQEPTIPGTSRRRTRSFDLAKLEVKALQGVWCLLDGPRLVFAFGADEAAAREALAVCRQYRFNQLVYVGNPVRLVYLAHNEQPPPPQLMANTVDQDRLELLRQAQSIALRGPIIPKVGLIGDWIVIEPRRLTLDFRQGQWILRHQEQTVAEFGYEGHAARTLERLMKDQKVNAVVHLKPTDIYLLFHNQQPIQRLPLNIASISFDRNQLRVQAQGEKWGVAENRRMLFLVGKNRADAQRLIKIIQHYRLDQLAWLGNPLKPSFRFLGKKW